MRAPADDDRPWPRRGFVGCRAEVVLDRREVLMFADGGEWLAAALAVVWVGLVLRAEGARRRRLPGRVSSTGVLAALGLAL